MNDGKVTNPFQSKRGSKGKAGTPGIQLFLCKSIAIDMITHP